MESAAARYAVKQNCDLNVVGELVPNLNYAIAVQKGNLQLTAVLSSAIMYLQETGKLDELADKWYGNGTCSPHTVPTNPLAIPFLLDVCYLLAVGVIFALVVAIIEGIVYCSRNSGGPGKKSDTMLSTLEEHKEDMDV